eukprot:PITA_11558
MSPTNQLLRSAEALTIPAVTLFLPPLSLLLSLPIGSDAIYHLKCGMLSMILRKVLQVQVIVLNANMNCEECRERVSKVLSKIDYLMDYVVDVTHKKVTVRGRVDPKKRIHGIELTNDKAIEFESPGGGGYPTDLQEQYCSNSWRKATENLIERGCCFCFVV